MCFQEIFVQNFYNSSPNDFLVYNISRFWIFSCKAALEEQKWHRNLTAAIAACLCMPMHTIVRILASTQCLKASCTDSINLSATVKYPWWVSVSDPKVESYLSPFKCQPLTKLFMEQVLNMYLRSDFLTFPVLSIIIIFKMSSSQEPISKLFFLQLSVSQASWLNFQPKRNTRYFSKK